MDFLSHDVAPPNAVDELLDRCFGPARRNRTAALLRRGAPRLDSASFVALDGDTLVGSVEVWMVEWRHPRGPRPMALLGPLVSHPARRGERIGMRLMDLAVAEIDKLKLPVMLVGDAPYYARWGFEATHTGEWQLPGPVDRERLLLRARHAQQYRGPAVIGASDGASAAA